VVNSAGFETSPAFQERPLGLCAVHTGGLIGLNFQPIVVEVCVRRGPSHFQLAGLAETAVREARIRLSSALMGLGINLDEYALVVNLAPANVRKSGSGLDLALALAILKAVGRLSTDLPERTVFFGEVALDGSLRGIPGILPLLDGAKNRGLTRAVVPYDNRKEAAQLAGMSVQAVRHISELIDSLSGCGAPQLVEPEVYHAKNGDRFDLSDVRGQAATKRALVVAAAGGHHLLMVGPPGAGKSLLARRLPGLLPPLSLQQAVETTKIHSIAGVLDQQAGIICAPPFRAPHHSVSEVGLVGGGSYPRPGEISLAHHGVLFLDELPEFRRNALESLRQPLEDHEVHIVRAQFRASFPSRPLLVAAMNPCACGNWGNPRASCRCATEARLRYLARISGPLLDRIDLHVVVPPADLKAWQCPPKPADWNTETARRKVGDARSRQLARKTAWGLSAATNSDLPLPELERVAAPEQQGRALLDLAIDKQQLSARSYVRVLRIARTLADLDDSDQVRAVHVGEALRYRINDLANC